MVISMLSPRRHRGFTIIELIVAVSIIGIIAAIVTANLSENRARARDANRTESVRNYSASLEQWKASYGTYFVYDRSIGGTAPSCTYNAAGNGFMTCSGATAVGFQGSGEGGITRKKLAASDTNPANYTTTSIADALLSAGYLAQIRLDPLDTAFNTNTTAESKYSDFILTLCKANSYPADSIKNSQEYAIYTLLERPDVTGEAEADTQCGGKSTPSGGWNTLLAR